MKPSVTRTLTTHASPEAVFDYLADFRNAEEWDPGTQTCERVSGEGGVGTTYRNVSKFLGRTSEITYVTEELERPTRLHMRGSNDDFEGHDVIGVRAVDEGTEVRYHAQFSFESKLAGPVVALYLPIYARKTIRQLQTSLDKLASDAR